MKAFTDRKPLVIGVVAIVVIVVLGSLVLVLKRTTFESAYPIRASFASAAGVGAGADVLLAGVPVGRVASVQLHGDHVILTLNIDHGVVLPHDTSASIQTETVLGVLDVSLHAIGGWARPLPAGDLITDTSMPTELYQLQDEAGRFFERVNTQAFNELVDELNKITSGNESQVKAIIDGLGRLTTTIDERSSELAQLIDAADSVSGLLASHDAQIQGVLDNLTTVVQGLADRSGEVAAFIQGIDAAGANTASLVRQDAPELDSLISHLESVLGVVASHQLDLAEAVSYLAAGVKGFASVGYSGPADTPNTWANIYTNLLVTSGVYGVLGACGALSEVENVALGPDPLPCGKRDGPSPSGSSSPARGSGGSKVSSVISPLLPGGGS